MLDHNADIYLKHQADDIQQVWRKDIEKRAGGRIMKQSQIKIQLHIYPLANIIKDTAAGADITSRFYSFLTS